jgi:hypothetical protein
MAPVMNSNLRIAANRRSAQTATRNVILAEMIVLSSESVPSFIQLITQLQEELQPETFVESGFVEVTAPSSFSSVARPEIVANTSVVSTPSKPTAPGESGKRKMPRKKSDFSTRTQFLPHNYLCSSEGRDPGPAADAPRCSNKRASPNSLILQLRSRSTDKLGSFMLAAFRHLAAPVFFYTILTRRTCRI